MQGRWILEDPGACWPASLAEPESLNLVSKNKVEEKVRKRLNSSLWLPTQVPKYRCIGYIQKVGQKGKKIREGAGRGKEEGRRDRRKG